MRVIIALAILAVCLSLGGCSRRQRVVYVEPTPLPSATEVTPRRTAVKRPKPGPVTALPPPQERSAASKTSSPKALSQPVTKLPAPAKVKPSSFPTTPAQNPSTPHPPISPDAKLKAAQEKAKISGVHTLKQEDIDGLSYEQIRLLRGY